MVYSSIVVVELKVTFFVGDAVVLSLNGAAVAHDSRVSFLQQQQFFLQVATTILVFLSKQIFLF
jgi:hypothetical protein